MNDERFSTRNKNYENWNLLSELTFVCDDNKMSSNFKEELFHNDEK